MGRFEIVTCRALRRSTNTLRDLVAPSAHLNVDLLETMNSFDIIAGL